MACAGFRGLVDPHAYLDVSILIPMVSIAVVAMLCGRSPGLLATCIIGLAHAYFSRNAFTLAPMAVTRLLLESGLLVSLFGGEVFAARKRTRISEAERLELERKVLEVGDDERRRIGHDLHDGLGQQLTGISLLSASLAQRIATGGSYSADDAEKISQLVTQSIGWTRDLARGLAPVTLEAEGLFAALQELAQNAQVIFRVCCQCRCQGTQPVLERQRAMHLYRIVQEAVSNAVKHGRAKNIGIELSTHENRLQLSVVDDGCGLSAKTKANPGIGLRIMQYRATMLGASLRVDRATATGGTIVTCDCKLSAAAPSRASD
jgi:signal transduction histidine kinase